MPTLLSQEDTLQRFDLPSPVLCSEGVLRVELIGKVQRQEDYDNLYYTWLVGNPRLSTAECGSFF